MLRRHLLPTLFAGALPAQTADSLGRFFEGAHGTAVLLEAGTGRTVAVHNPDLAERLLVPPGSTVKPFALAALVESGKLNPNESYRCPGKLEIAGFNLACTHPRALPPMNVRTAIAYSCNCFVARYAERLSPNDLPGEHSPSDRRLQALGVEGIRITPANLAKAYNRRSWPAAVQTGLEGAVEYGTAHQASIPNLKLAGKTGSVRTREGAHYAWFAGFTQKHVITVLLQARSGGADAAPIAREILRGVGLLACLLISLLFPLTAKAQTTLRIRLKPALEATTQTLPLEQYVAAVLAAEAGTLTSSESLRAMAVAARTYALHNRNRHAAEGYDLCGTTHCQRAEPSQITGRQTAAADATAGQLLWYRGALAEALYTKDCGGQTEAGEAPYLLSHPDPYCPRTPWRWSSSTQAIQTALERSSLRTARDLAAIHITRRTGSGRAAEAALVGPTQSVQIAAGSLRLAIGRAITFASLRSDWWDAQALPGRIEFTGRGEGHGIGLCQLGADGMGAAGKTWREILAFYYPGTTLGPQYVQLSGEAATLFTANPGQDGAILAITETAIRDLVARTHWPVPRPIEIRAYPDLDTYRSATTEPGWVAAHTNGRRIDLQPPSVLRSRGALESTLRHELAHVFIESQAAPGLPLWFREGLAANLIGAQAGGSTNLNEAALAQRADEQTAREANRAAAARVSALAQRHGLPTLLNWVRTGLPR